MSVGYYTGLQYELNQLQTKQGVLLLLSTGVGQPQQGTDVVAPATRLRQPHRHAPAKQRMNGAMLSEAYHFERGQQSENSECVNS
jgi:hypothetical protein